MPDVHHLADRASASGGVTADLSLLLAAIADGPELLAHTWLCRVAAATPIAAGWPARALDDASAVFHTFLKALETGDPAQLRLRTTVAARHVEPGAITSDSTLRLLLPLRDVLARHLAATGGERALDGFEHAANRLLTSLAGTFGAEHLRALRERDDQLRVAWAPAVPLRDRLLVLPVVGLMNDGRPRRLSEHVLVSIHVYRARVVVLDLRSVPAIGCDAAFELRDTFEAARLVGATMILTGLGPDARRALAEAGALPSVLMAADLQSGVGAAERLLGRCPANPSGDSQRPERP